MTFEPRRCSFCRNRARWMVEGESLAPACGRHVHALLAGGQMAAPGRWAIVAPIGSPTPGLMRSALTDALRKLVDAVGVLESKVEEAPAVDAARFRDFGPVRSVEIRLSEFDWRHLVLGPADAARVLLRGAK